MSNALVNPESFKRIIGALARETVSVAKEIDTGTPNLWPLLPKDPPILSPRYQWRKDNGVCVSYHPNREHKNEHRAQIGFACVVADTEDEAEAAIALKMNIQLYGKP